MLSFEDVLKEFEEFLHAATYLEVLPCRWGSVSYTHLTLPTTERV